MRERKVIWSIFWSDLICSFPPFWFDFDLISSFSSATFHLQQHWMEKEAAAAVILFQTCSQQVGIGSECPVEQRAREGRQAGRGSSVCCHSTQIFQAVSWLGHP